jgi:multiple sugar transport system ATP-binding protein
MFEGKIVGNKFVSDLFSYDLTAEQQEKLKDYNNKEVILGVRPENITTEGNIDFVVTNNENLGMNTLVHGKINGTKIVVCKFARWCTYKFGDKIKIGFESDRMHFFDKQTTLAIR